MIGRANAGRANAALAAASLLLTGFIGWRLWAGLDARSPPTLRQPAAASLDAFAAPPLAAFAAPPLTAFTAVIERPLFVPDRRPRDPEPQAQADAGALRLVGVVASKNRMAAVLRDGDGRTYTLAAGEAGPGWRVTLVESDRAMVEDAGGVREHRLSPRAAEPPTATTTTTAAPPLTRGERAVHYR